MGPVLKREHASVHSALQEAHRRGVTLQLPARVSLWLAGDRSVNAATPDVGRVTAAAAFSPSRTRRSIAFVRILAGIVTLALVSSPAQAVELRDGDLVFQESRSSQSRAIQLATGSRYSHVGVVVLRDGKPHVYEAVGPVQTIPLKRWVARGVGGHFAAKRLAARTLDAAALSRMRAEADKHRGKPYDWVFNWSDERMYCSELVWKLYERGAGIRLAEPKPLGSFRLDHPAVKKKLRQRYGDKIPLAEPMVAPQQLFDSPLLTTATVSAPGL